MNKPTLEWRRVRRLFVTLGLAVAVAIACLPNMVLSKTWIVRTLQFQVDDALPRPHNPPSIERAQAANIALVAVDGRSQVELGYWQTWPRGYYARVIDALTAAGARVIALDLPLTGSAPDEDLLAASVRSSGRVIEPVTSGGDHQKMNVRGGFPVYQQPIVPMTRLASNAGLLALISVEPGEDGVVRSEPLAAWIDGRLYPSVSLAAASVYLQQTNPLERSVTHGTLQFAGREIPIDDYGRMLIHYLGPPSRLETNPSKRTFPWTSFGDVLQGRSDPATFRDKIVFVGVYGSSGSSGGDWTPTSTALMGTMDAVEIHANATATILSGGLSSREAVFLTRQDDRSTAVIVASLSVLAALVVSMLPAWRAGVLSLLLLMGYDLIMARVWWSQGVLPNLVLPSVAVIGATMLSVVYRVVFEEQDHLLVRRALDAYLSPVVMDTLMANPDSLVLGGERREMTVLFSDLREFTSLSEKLDAGTLEEILTSYLGAMTEVLERRDGVLDKYIGDQIMAFWGAPVDQPLHALLACETALDMVAELSILNQMWSNRELPVLSMGIGVNTGMVSVGNFGSDTRFDYTVMGDPVNVCSRLQELNKRYGTRVLITASTYQAVRSVVIARYVDDVAIRGKSDSTAIYELLGRASDHTVSPFFLAAWDTAIDLYHQHAWRLAADAFARILERRPDDAVARLYVSRCADHESSKAPSPFAAPVPVGPSVDQSER